jgi:hypothetical protein
MIMNWLANFRTSSYPYAEEMAYTDSIALAYQTPIKEIQRFFSIGPKTNKIVPVWKVQLMLWQLLVNQVWAFEHFAVR